MNKKQLIATVLLLVIFLPLSVKAEEFDYEFLRKAQDTSAEGFFWMKMTKEEKSSYLMGYEDGYLNALGYDVKDKQVKEDAISKLPSFYNADNVNKDSLISKLDEFYSQHVAYKIFPVPLAIRLIIYKEIGIKSEVDDKQVKFFEDLLNKTVENRTAGEGRGK